ncbi:MAG TPA: penicillin-binding protein 2 [Candidatus Paceibacterota bacterium]|nr:penicillin-binding protein 2 [Candidatus Paceibacterota bacterium]
MGKQDSPRIKVLFGLVAIVAGLVAWRLFVLSITEHTFYAQTALAQDQGIGNVLVRGNIYIQDPKAGAGSGNQYVVATDKKFPYAYVNPSKVSDSVAVENAIQSVLGIDPQAIAPTISAKQNITKVLERKISDDQAAKIKDLDLDGLGVQYEMDRYYPAGTTLSSVLGYYGFDSQGRSGQYGVESYLDDELDGTVTNAVQAASATKTGGFMTDVKNLFSTGNTEGSTTPRPADVVLTIDRNIQSFIENELQTTMDKWHASGGTVIVQEPQTGKILAMADWPNFDPNDYGSFPAGTYLNRSVQATFEPGSSFKPITMAMGLDLNKVTPETTYTDPGVITFGSFNIYNFDHKSHGTVDMTTVLEDSLNTGAAFVENLVGQQKFLDYAINFGFGQKTGIDLPGEVNGNIANLYSGRQVNFTTASFGQGIAVTPLQLIDAYSAIANGGKVMRPYVVDKVMYEDGSVQETKPQVVSIPITPKTASTLSQMLVNVVDKGFDRARISGYTVAGKTGTAQIPDSNGGYEEGTFIHDFLGFAPASNPKFVVLVKMDRPQGITYAADSLSPVFRDIAKYLINYYNIPPDR